jgi:hypothetical protein
MPFVNDTANSSTPVNDAPYEASILTIADMDIMISEAELTLSDPRSPWKKDAANVSSPVNDAANT